MFSYVCKQKICLIVAAEDLFDECGTPFAWIFPEVPESKY